MATLGSIALFVALVSWAFASPLGASPDDQYHMPSIWCGQGLRDGLCERGDSAQEREVPEALVVSSGCFAFDSDLSAWCTEPPSTALVVTKEGNFVGDYPPVYYWTLGLFVSPSIEASVLAMRVVNSAVFVGVMVALLLLLPSRRRGAFVWGGLAAIVPLGMFLIPSVNPSSWAVISAFALWHSLVGYFEAVDRRHRIAFGSIATLVTVMGSGARSDAAVYSVLAIVVAAALTGERTRAWLKLAILPAILAVVAAVFFATSGQSSIVNLDGDSGLTTPGGVIHLAIANFTLLPELWTGALGTTGLGWLDTPMPPIVWVSVLAVFAGFAFWGLQYLGRRKAFALSLVFVALIVIPMYILVNDGVTVGIGVQPRYIYPMMIMFVSIALFRMNADGPGLSRVHYFVAAISIAIANSMALHTNIRRYVTGLDVNGVNLDANPEWWWDLSVGPMAVWTIGSVAFGLVMAAALVHSLPGRATAGPSAAEDAPSRVDSPPEEPRRNGIARRVG